MHMELPCSHHRCDTRLSSISNTYEYVENGISLLFSPGTTTLPGTLLAVLQCSLASLQRFPLWDVPGFHLKLLRFALAEPMNPEYQRPENESDKSIYNLLLFSPLSEIPSLIQSNSLLNIISIIHLPLEQIQVIVSQSSSYLNPRPPQHQFQTPTSTKMTSFNRDTTGKEVVQAFASTLRGKTSKFSQNPHFNSHISTPKH